MKDSFTAKRFPGFGHTVFPVTGEVLLNASLIEMASSASEISMALRFCSKRGLHELSGAITCSGHVVDAPG